MKRWTDGAGRVKIFASAKITSRAGAGAWLRLPPAACAAPGRPTNLPAMSVVPREPWSVERFLLWEDAQDEKHEFDGTRIVEMTGGSRAHQRIIFNIMRLLSERLDPAAFDAVHEMRVDVGGKVRYPDVVVCAGRVPDGVRTLRDAVATFEILSDDTVNTDRETKRIEYARLPGMRRYVLLEQYSMAATVLELVAGAWVETKVSAGNIAFPETGIELPMDEIYRGVRLRALASA